MRRALAAAVGAAATLTTMLATTGPAVGTFPDDNGRIAFAAEGPSGFEIYTIRPDGSHLRRLTHLAGDASQPDWGPAGRRIAFSVERPDGTADLMMMRADGSHLRRLTHAGFQIQPSFTRDGAHLLYECDCFPQGIFVVRTDGTGRHRLTTHGFRDEADSDPNVSPDGRTVTFVRHKVDGQLQALMAVDRDGANVRRLVPYTREVAIKHDWAPDGKHLVITVDADYPHGRSPNVATVRADGSHLTMLTHYSGGAVGAFAGSYSPDGRWIAFRVENLDKQRFRLFKMHPDGSHRTLIASLPFAPRNVDWGPHR